MDLVSKINYDDKEELLKMPLCSEKVLINLMHDLSRIEDEQFLLNDMNKLRERLETEGSLTYEVECNLKDVIFFLNRKDFIAAFEVLRKIHNLIRDLNIPKLQRLAKENKNALDKVNGKEIFLFIGHTGSGILLKIDFN